MKPACTSRSAASVLLSVPPTKTHRAIFNCSIHTRAQLGPQFQTAGGAEHFPRQKAPSRWEKKHGPKNSFTEIMFRTASLLSPIQFLAKFRLNFKIFSDSKSNLTSLFGCFVLLLVQFKHNFFFLLVVECW